MKHSICYCPLLTAYSLLCFAQAPETLWTRTHGYADDDAGYDVKQTADGGYIIVGYATFWLSVYDKEAVYLIKTDANGDTVWTETYGWWDSYSHAHEVQQTFNGGYVIAVELNTHNPVILKDVWITKNNCVWCYAVAAILWNRQQSRRFFNPTDCG